MQYPAQVQACIELLDVQLDNVTVADRLLHKYFRARRYIGSKDRAKITELFYSVLRQRRMVEFLLEQIGEAASSAQMVAASLWLENGGSQLNSIFTGEKYQPEPLSSEFLSKLLDFDLEELDPPQSVRYNVPEWLMPHFERRFEANISRELEALNDKAPVDIRVNTLNSDRTQLAAELNAIGISTQITPLSDLGLRFEQRVAVSNLDTFRNGDFEVQDEGSQLLAAVCNVKAGQKVIDFCAGAGGKTLALAAAMGNKGSLIACDVSEPRLKELSKRAKRAGVFNIRPVLLNSERDKVLKRHIKTADVVLVDAPCSGSGAWRRNPDARFNLTPERLEQLYALQAEILDSAARLVKPNGYLVYATCSVFNEENRLQIDRFISNNNDLYKVFDVTSTLISDEQSADKHALAEHLHAQASPFLELSPASSNTDGFFAALLQRKSTAADHA